MGKSGRGRQRLEMTSPIEVLRLDFEDIPFLAPIPLLCAGSGRVGD